MSRDITWRNGRDLNPRGVNPSAFKADAFGRSATVPGSNLSWRKRGHRPTLQSGGERRGVNVNLKEVNWSRTHGTHTCSNLVIWPPCTVTRSGRMQSGTPSGARSVNRVAQPLHPVVGLAPTGIGVLTSRARVLARDRVAA